MEFIKAEEFLGQPVEVQNVLLEWWKPSIGDLFTTKRVYDEIDVIVDTTVNDIFGMNRTFYGNIYNSVDKSLFPFPLLSEGQLRQFIEDKTMCKITVNPSVEGKYHVGYDEWVGIKDKTQLIYTDNLLQAYWKVAIEVAKEDISNDL